LRANLTRFGNQLGLLADSLSNEKLDFSKTANLSQDEIQKKIDQEAATLKILNITGCKEIQTLNLSACKNLEELFAGGCVNLKSLKISKNATFKDLRLRDCTSLNQCDFNDLLPVINNSANLRILCLDNNLFLESLDLSKSPQLKYLLLGGCLNLENLEIHQNVTFKDLRLDYCMKLNQESLKKLLPVIQNSKNLEEFCFLSAQNLMLLDLSNHKALRTLFLAFSDISTINLQNNQNLTRLSFTGCKNLKTVANLNSCTKLEVLSFADCAELDRVGWWPSNYSTLNKYILPNLPTSLTSLDLRGCKNVTKEVIAELRKKLPKESCEIIGFKE